MKGWVDLRNLAVTKETYGKVLLKKLQQFEEELAYLYPNDNNDVKIIKFSQVIGILFSDLNWTQFYLLSIHSNFC